MPPSPAASSWPRRWGWGALPLAFLLLFFAVPLSFLVVFALGDRGGAVVLDIARGLFTVPYYRNRIWFTFEQAFLSTLLTLAAGLPLAYVFSSYRFRGKRILRAAFTAPFVMPPIVVAIALQAFLGSGGTADRLLGWDVLNALGPYGAILVAHVFYNLGVVLRIVGAYWERVPWEYRESARTLGGRPRSVLWRVLVPLGAPAIASAALLVFLFCASSFGIVLLLGGGRKGTIETLIYGEVASFLPNYDTAAVLGLLQLGFTLLVVLAYLWLQRRARARFPPRVGEAPQPLPAPAWLLLAPLTLLLVGPSLSLVGRALWPPVGGPLAGFAYLGDPAYALGSYTAWAALRNSLGFAALCVLIAVPLALLSGLAVRGLGRTRAWLEAGLLAPLGVSSVLVGLGFLLGFDGAPLWDLRASPFRIVLAHVLIAFPFVTRIVAPSLDAIDARLVEAAATLGARAPQRLWRVEIPLLLPALQAAAVFAFAASLGEFGATLLLRRPQFTTIPLAIYDGYGRVGAPFRLQAEALSALLLLVAALAFWSIERGTRGPRGELA